MRRRLRLGEGEAAVAYTGGMLAGNADAVVMVENTQYIDADTIEVMRPVAPGENVAQPGGRRGRKRRFTGRPRDTPPGRRRFAGGGAYASFGSRPTSRGHPVNGRRDRAAAHGARPGDRFGTSTPTQSPRKWRPGVELPSRWGWWAMTTKNNWTRPGGVLPTRTSWYCRPAVRSAPGTARWT